MGRGGRGQASWDESWAEPRSVQYWRGAWPRKTADPAHEAAFPRYDATALAPARSQKGKGKYQDSTEYGDGQPEDMLVPDMQELLNNARKAEQRVRQLARQKDAKAAQWKAYLAKLKKAYLEEHHRHTRDLQRITEDYAKAMTAQDAARAEIRNMACMLAGGHPLPAHPAREEGNWDAMLEHMHSEQHLDAPRAVLERAMAAGRDPPPRAVPMEVEREVRHARPLEATTTASDLPHFGPAVPSTPPHRPQGGVDGTPPAISKATSYAPVHHKGSRLSEPYLASPGATGGGAAGPMAGATPEGHRMNPEQRPSHPEGFVSATAAALAAKLADKRAGDHGKPSEAPSHGGSTDVPTARMPPTGQHGVPGFLIEDDEEDLTTAETPDVPGQASPGLGKME